MFATTLLTFFKGRLVGVDSLGNKYYEEKFILRAPRDGRPRRWVIYKGISEASKAAPELHGWLHFTTDKTPTESREETYKWERAHLPNLTGTSQAYYPPKNVKAKPYKAWTPQVGK